MNSPDIASISLFEPTKLELLTACGYLNFYSALQKQNQRKVVIKLTLTAKIGNQTKERVVTSEEGSFDAEIQWQAWQNAQANAEQLLKS